MLLHDFCKDAITALDVCRITMVGKSLLPKCGVEHKDPSSRTSPGRTCLSKWVDTGTAPNWYLKIKPFELD